MRMPEIVVHMIMIAQGNFQQVEPLVVKPVWHTENRYSCGHADHIEPQMIGQKGEEKLSWEDRFADQSAAPKPALNREGNKL